MNKINSILKGSVIALCVVGTMLLLKAVFNGAEFGSVSDWVSSISTFGTLTIAIAAYRKAPDWINQKKHEDGYELAKKLIVYEYPEIMTTISKYYNHLHLIKRKSEGDEVIISLLKGHITVDDCDFLLDCFKNEKITPLTIQATIKQLSRFNWFLKKDLITSAQNIRSDYESIQIRSYVLWSAIKLPLQNSSGYIIDDNLKKAVDNIRNDVEELQKTLKKFEEFDVDFEMYFDKTSAKNKGA
ncbi:hypothetical protein EDF88_4300 [Buttiauxella sp. BIGb0552]|uniref:hypothetical protein n=1 Tax=Buttiauxella sp. BIGb0552 TaxID=2485120 RepID=UPI001064FE5F|nr:hypothetical protein [Buttiauxella sp. BIGb0552]TDX13019.1 hypothetical protein EDF88_4300 [Buttiauxella sp. BIGb0552]